MLLSLVSAAGEAKLSLYDQILYPFMWVVGWILRGVHEMLRLFGIKSGAGIGWVLAIVGMTIVVRLIIVPLFIKQIKASRAMSLAQPELTAAGWVRSKPKRCGIPRSLVNLWVRPCSVRLPPCRPRLSSGLWWLTWS